MIGVTIGNFSTAEVDGRFKLAYLVRHTIANLTTQDDQVACFCNVAAYLERGGCFVIEVYVPELRRLPPGETVHTFTVTPTHWLAVVWAKHDPAQVSAFTAHGTQSFSWTPPSKAA